VDTAIKGKRGKRGQVANIKIKTTKTYLSQQNLTKNNPTTIIPLLIKALLEGEEY
jgi:hypothetical protein